MLFSVAIRRHPVASGSRVQECPIFFMPRVLRSDRIASKLDMPSGLSMRKNILEEFLNITALQVHYILRNVGD